MQLPSHQLSTFSPSGWRRLVVFNCREDGSRAAEQKLLPQPQLTCAASIPLVFKLEVLGLHSGKQIGQRHLLYRLGGLC